MKNSYKRKWNAQYAKHLHDERLLMLRQMESAHIVCDAYFYFSLSFVGNQRDAMKWLPVSAYLIEMVKQELTQLRYSSAGFQQQLPQQLCISLRWKRLRICGR